MFDINTLKELEKTIQESSVRWLKVDADKDFEFKYSKMSSRALTTKLLVEGKQGKTEEEMTIDLLFDCITDWRNVKLKDVMSEEVREKVLEAKLFTLDQLNEDVPFSHKLFEELVSIHSLVGSMFIAINGSDIKKKTSKKSK